MRFATLQAWLDWQAAFHPKAIDLGLERVRAVAARLDLLHPQAYVITVGGTNGKGSSVALLETALVLSGQRVVAYSSPHLDAYNERIRRNLIPADDTAIIAAFAAIDAARGDISLSYFEFGTLAAIWLAREFNADCLVLEVGLGGRLDAVNLLDAEIALVTSIGLDHTDWLGPDLDSIGREKAGIARPGKPLVVAQRRAPAGLLETARALGATLVEVGVDYDFWRDGTSWGWSRSRQVEAALPLPALPGAHQVQNAAGVMTVLALLPPGLRPEPRHWRQALAAVRLAGRFEQVRTAAHTVIFDVAHNPDSARALAATLHAYPFEGRTVALFGVMRDKEVEVMFEALGPYVDEWLLVQPEVDRAMGVDELARRLRPVLPDASVTRAGTTTLAWQLFVARCGHGDRLLVTGSFYTVAEARRILL
ncbi:MAG: bifunctional tetrahydrofolate synthase/dihydrofolate synthase [Thiotrichales bacterium]